MANRRLDIVCLSHLRWGRLHERPQHVMSRFARHGRVLFCEEPILEPETAPQLEARHADEGVIVLQPRMPPGLSSEASAIAQSALLETAMRKLDILDFVLWYYTPMALRYTEYLESRAVVYDCMEEISPFPGTPSEFQDHERQLLARADLVFTDGRGTRLERSRLHPSVHALPSGHESLSGTGWDRIWSSMDVLLQALVRDDKASAEAGPALLELREGRVAADEGRSSTFP